MAILTGDRYLDLLSRFVEEQAGALLDGNLVLKLNPVGLHYVQTRLDALHELERIRAGAPVDYLRAYIADLGDHRALEQLRRVLNLLSAVKVVSVLPTPARDPSPVTLSPFGRLRSLELRGCDLSSSAARGLLELRPILERLICHNSADALRHIFTERIVEIKDAQVWSRLAYVSCASNGMLLMDESLQLLPALQYMDLSRNRFAKAANLHRCSRLKFLDLGFNQLQNISALSQLKSQITKLVLRNNCLVNVHGIGALTCLDALDLSHNLISKFKELKSVASIRSLKLLFLEGNPISVHSSYREEVFSLFSDPSKVCLDGRNITRSEIWSVSRIVLKRQKQEAVYGSYAPAESFEAEGFLMENESTAKHVLDAMANMPRGKRKVSRLALIQDAQLHVQEPADQDESTGLYASGNLPRDTRERWPDVVGEVEQEKEEVLQLMQRVEALKEEGSKTWLQDLKVLLEDNIRQSGPGHQDFEIQHDKKKPMSESKLKGLRKRWSRRRRRFKQKSTEEGAVLEQEREESADSQLSKEYHSLQNYSLASNGSFESLGTGVDEHSLSDVASDLPYTSSPKPLTDQHSSEEKNRKVSEHDTGGHTDENAHSGLGYTADEEQTSMDENLGSWRVINEMLESQGATGTVRSPPQYHKEVLQKRQDLEEEFLRLSLDSGCAPSSNDSETSSDDTLMTVSSSEMSEDSPKTHITFREMSESGYKETSQPQPALHKSVGDSLSRQNRSNSSSEESMYSDSKDRRRNKPSSNHNSMGSCNFTSTPQEKSMELSRTGHLEPACADDILANAGGGMTQDSLKILGPKPKVKRKMKRARTVEIIEDVKDTDGNAGEFQTNGVCSAANRLSVVGCEVLEGSNIGPVGGNTVIVLPRDQVVATGGSSTGPVETFCIKLGNAEEHEVCLRFVKCGCFRLWDDAFVERDVYLCVSDKNKLYMLIESRRDNLSAEGSAPDLQVIACHELTKVKRVTVGLWMQALRVDIGKAASYLFMPRNVNTSREIFDILKDSEANTGPVIDVESWEHRQLKLFEKLVLHGARASILMYLMPLFCYGETSENTWLARSVFLTSHQIFLCIEDLIHFGSDSEDLASEGHPYIRMEACAKISDLSEVVVSLSDGCITLKFEKIIALSSVTKHPNPRVWRFKGVVDQTATKLVALLRASHLEVTLHPLTVTS